jgi:hypothetical protein
MAETKQKTGRSTKKGASFRPAALALAFTALTAALTGCTDSASGPETHVHDWDDWENVGATYTKLFDTDPPVPATHVAPGSMIEKTLQDQSRQYRNDGTVETRTKTVTEQTLELPVGKRIVNGELVDLPPQTLPVMASPVNVNVINLLSTYNNDGANISGVDADEAEGTIRGVLIGMKTQAANLRDWFAAAKESYPTKADQLDRLWEMEKGIVSAISPSSITPSAFHAAMDNKIQVMFNIIWGLDTQGLVDRAVFEKYFNAYTKGQYLGARDWQMDTAALSVTNTDFQTLIDTARTEAAGDDTAGTIRPLTHNWNNGRNAAISNYNSASNGNGPQDGVFKYDLMNIMKKKITDALGLTGVENADKMAEALIIQTGQDNEEFRALIDDFQKATELAIAGDTTYTHNLTNVLNATYNIAQTQPQSLPRLAHIDAQTQFPLDAVKPGAHGSDYTVNFIPRKDEKSV